MNVEVVERVVCDWTTTIDEINRFERQPRFDALLLMLSLVGGNHMYRALFSVSDKRNLCEFARTVIEHGKLEVMATGGTFTDLSTNQGLARFVDRLVKVEDVTGFPSLLGGRVKSLHPNVFAGLLADTNNFAAEATPTAHGLELSRYGIKPVRLLVCNLYDFDSQQDIEHIDIGGVALLRAAAKNFENVIVVSDPADYSWVGNAFKASPASPLSISQRQELALKAFEYTSKYDAKIAHWMASHLQQERSSSSSSSSSSSFSSSTLEELFPQRLTLSATKVSQLRYGENPHQSAAVYRAEGEEAPFIQMGGKEISYNNVLDTESAWGIVEEWDPAHHHAAALVKHNTPCGVAAIPAGKDAALLAFRRAFACDPVSAFGGILAVNTTVDVPLLEAIDSLFLEVIVAPGFTQEALERLKATKKNCRSLKANPLARPPMMTVRSIRSGFLAQSVDVSGPSSQWKTATKRQIADQAMLQDLQFAWQTVKHVKSNAIACVKDGATIGIGGGQPNRVASVELALKLAGDKARGAVLASDAFFPFADSIEMAAKAGIIAIVQTGGSIRDQEVIDAADKHGIVMILTSQRHFRH